MSRKPWANGVRQTVSGILTSAAAKWPDHIFVDMLGDRTYTFGEMDEIATRVANGLAARGVKRGDSVCVMLDNSIDILAFLFGAARLGAIYVPLSTALKGEFLRHQIAECNAASIVIESDLAPALAAVIDALPDLACVYYRGDRPELNFTGDLEPMSLIWSEDRTPIAIESQPHEICMLLYTSGTTGLSKACMVSNNYVCYYSRGIVYTGDMRPEDRLYVPTKLFHMAAISQTLASLLNGSRVIIDRHFSVSRFWETVRDSGATLGFVLGAMIALLANAEDTEASKACYGQIRRLIGAPFTPDSEAKWNKRFGVKFARNTGYGMSECYPLRTPPHANPPPGASGQPDSSIDARVIGDDGQECPPNVPGELIIRPLEPDVIFSGYWNRPQETLKAFDNLWFHTGDLGLFDENGWFFFVDRKKDYLRRRGENISSYEMEAAFMKHPAIEYVAVHAVLSELTEDDVKVTAVLREGVVLGEEELCRWALDRVPYYAVPRYIEFRTMLPYTPSGRVQKYQLREEGVTERTWDREKSQLVVAPRR